MDPILELCKKYNLFLIEDSAEMHGQQYYDKKCGSFGDISTFSFYPNKLITTGEGGMILTDNNELNEACRKLRNLAFEPRKKRFVHYEMGWNYRMTNLQAALGIAQLENIEKHINRKREIGKMYNDRLNNTNYIKLMPTKTKYSENIYWVYSILLEDIFPLNAEMMMIKLKDEGIGTRPFFHPMHLQPVFNKMGLFNNEKYPVAEKISNRGFYIPCGLGISDSEIQKVADALNKIISKY
jgi:perosamine synthetase